MITYTDKKISSPEINTVVFYQPFYSENDKRKKAYPVLIKTGDYFRNGRVSNFWYWQPLTGTGKFKGKVGHGYGIFTVAEGWEVEIKIKVKTT